MANIVNFSTYGFLDDILALNEDNWRNFFKPIVYDSVQGGLEVTAGTGMKVNVSAGECRCGSIMGISNSQVSLDVNVGDNTYSRIDSVVIQYTYGEPSTLSIAVLQGEPSASPVAPTLTKSYNSLWQMEIAQILIPPNATTTAECTITDKRVIYNSLDSIIDPINESIDSINDDIDDINEALDNKVDEAPSDNLAYSRINGEWSTNVTSYGYCTTAAGTVAKTVSITGFKLVTGATIFVKFKEKNTATNPTLNVSSTGAKRIYRWGTTSAGTTDSTNGWTAGAVLALTYDGTGWIEHLWQNTTYTIYGAYCTTAADTADKVATCTYYELMPGYFEITMRYANTAQSALTLNIASKGAKPIYINGTASSSTNYTLLNGVYIVYYDGTNYYFRTDGQIEGIQTSLASQGAVAPVFSETVTYAVDACVMYQGKLYKFLSAHSPGPWVGGNEVVETNALAQSGGGGGSGGVGDEITFNDSNSAMIITSSNRSINSLESAIAIISSGDTHPAINAGQYVYIKLHSNISGIADLPEGLYVAKTSISANVALTTSNVSSVSGGGLNNLLINIPNYYNNAGFHNSIFRGNSLGSSISSTQWSEISAGTFKDLFIGDYWTINNINWRIASFDYWLRCGDTECTTHHIVIVPDSNLLTADGSTTHFMDTANVTSGGYLGSGFRSGTNHDSGSTANTSRQQCINIVNNAFGSSHILTHREYFTNAVTNGKPSAGAWADSTVDMMNERMVYGNAPFSPVSDGTTVPANYTIDKGQLPLFALAPQYICNRADWWLRDPVSSAPFAVVGTYGTCACSAASAAGVGVRPAFGIK